MPHAKNKMAQPHYMPWQQELILQLVKQFCVSSHWFSQDSPVERKPDQPDRSASMPLRVKLVLRARSI